MRKYSNKPEPFTCSALVLVFSLVFTSFSSPVKASDEDEMERLEYKYQIEYYFVDLFREINIDRKHARDKQNKKSSWKYRAFILRVRPRLGFNIPGMVTLSVVPETEFYWSRF
ncbi:MAG: hypothetical protein HRU09_17665 [Oligoflexales bacterium]|nr:hypothetical protein [Oligoflexales bacterium]